MLISQPVLGSLSQSANPALQVMPQVFLVQAAVPWGGAGQQLPPHLRSPLPHLLDALAQRPFAQIKGLQQSLAP
jgi:hypothetical protein